MKLLVSVRSVEEALLAAAAGADFIDLKEPSAGALGALPLATSRDVVAALRAQHPHCKISATVGDFAPDAIAPVIARAATTAACGVDYVKVGIARGARGLLEALATTSVSDGTAIVPVFIADHGLDAALIESAGALHFPALMLDTADKTRGSLFDVLPSSTIAGFIEQARAQGQLSGLAGALRLSHLPTLARLAPDFAGFRSAVCAGPRTGGLDVQRVRVLRERLPSAATPAEQGHAVVMATTR